MYCILGNCALALRSSDVRKRHYSMGYERQARGHLQKPGLFFYSLAATIAFRDIIQQGRIRPPTQWFPGFAVPWLWLWEVVLYGQDHPLLSLPKSFAIALQFPVLTSSTEGLAGGVLPLKYWLGQSDSNCALSAQAFGKQSSDFCCLC